MAGCSMPPGGWRVFSPYLTRPCRCSVLGSGRCPPSHGALGVLVNPAMNSSRNRILNWNPFKLPWCRLWLSLAPRAIRLTLRRKGLPVTPPFGILTENRGSVPIVVLNVAFCNPMKSRIALDPLMMCKFFFLSPLSLKKKNIENPPTFLFCM